MSQKTLKDVKPDLDDAVMYFSNQCPVCHEIVKYLATQEHGAAYLDNMSEDLKLVEDSKAYTDAINYLVEQEVLYDADGFVGLTAFGNSVEKLL